MKESDFLNLNFTVIGSEANLEGELRFSGDVLVNGSIKGTITVENGAKLTLERTGNIEGFVYCGEFEVFGKVQGTIDSSENLVVRAGANVSGIINAKTISISPGATVNMDGHTQEEASSD